MCCLKKNVSLYSASRTRQQPSLSVAPRYGAFILGPSLTRFWKLFDIVNIGKRDAGGVWLWRRLGNKLQNIWTTVYDVSLYENNEIAWWLSLLGLIEVFVISLKRNEARHIYMSCQLKRQSDQLSTWEFDSGSERTLAAGLTHASRTRSSLRWVDSGRRVSNAWQPTFFYGTTVGNDC